MLDLDTIKKTDHAGLATILMLTLSRLEEISSSNGDMVRTRVNRLREDLIAALDRQ